MSLSFTYCYLSLRIYAAFLQANYSSFFNYALRFYLFCSTSFAKAAFFKSYLAHRPKSMFCSPLWLFFISLYFWCFFSLICWSKPSWYWSSNSCLFWLNSTSGLKRRSEVLLLSCYRVTCLLLLPIRICR